MTDTVSFIGGMNVPAAFGRFNATWPLAELVIEDRRLCLRPRFLSYMFTSYSTDLNQISTAFPLRGTVMTGGIGFTLLDRSTAYFWTSGNRGQEVLTALAARGVDVRQEAQRATRIWRMKRSGASTAELPHVQARVRLLLPILIVLSLLPLSAMLARSDSSTFRVTLIAFWLLCLASTLALFRTGREQ